MSNRTWIYEYAGGEMKNIDNSKYIREAIHDWLREDAPISIKLVLIPSYIEYLVQRIQEKISQK